MSIETIHQIQQAIMASCLIALAVLMFAFACWRIFPGLTQFVRGMFGSMSVFGRCLTGALVCCLVYTGATKSKVRLEYDSARQQGLVDEGSKAEDNLLSVRWRYVGIPGASKVYIDRRPYGSEEEWTNLGETIASARAWEYTTAYPATNDEYYVWWYYDAPAPVHTNGVWLGQAYRTHNGRGIITINTRIEDFGRVIATPEKKREAQEVQE